MGEKEGTGLLWLSLLAMLVFMLVAPGRTIHSHLPHPRNVTLDYINPFNNNSLHVAGFGTGDLLSGEFDLIVGDGEIGGGLIKMGPAEIGKLGSTGSIGNLFLDGIFILRDANATDNNISFMFTTPVLPRFVIPVEGPDFATYNPRSMMVGGDLGQSFNDDLIRCSDQGYDKLDCDTDSTGADLGIQDDLQVRGKGFFDNDIRVGDGSQGGIEMVDEVGGLMCIRCWNVSGACNFTAGAC